MVTEISFSGECGAAATEDGTEASRYLTALSRFDALSTEQFWNPAPEVMRLLEAARQKRDRAQAAYLESLQKNRSVD